MVTWWPKDAASSGASTWTSSTTGETWTKTGSALALHVQGTYYGRLLPGTPIRVTATRSAVDYPIWAGYVRRAPQSYPSFGLDAEVVLTAVDSLAWLQDIPAPTSPAEFDARDTFCRHYWPLHEPPTVNVAADTFGDLPGQWTATRAAGSPTQDGARSLATSQLAIGAQMMVPTMLDWDISSVVGMRCEVYLPDTSATFRIVFGDGTNTGALCYGMGGVYYAQAPGGTARVLATRLPAGRHSVNFSAVGGTLTLSFNGAPAGFDGTTTSVSASNGVLLDGTGAAVSDLALCEDFASTQLIGQSGGAGQTTSERLVNLLYLSGMFGFTVALVDLFSDETTWLGPTTLGGTFGDLVRGVNTAEQGVMYVSGAGDFTARSRLWKWTDAAATTSQATFGDATGEVPYSAITIDPASRESVVNDVVVSLASGATAQYQDSASVREIGRRTLSLSAPLASLEDGVALGRHIVTQRGWPRIRITGLTLNARASADCWTQVLTRTIGERVTINRRPTDTLAGGTATDPITEDVWIERVSHSITRGGTWTTSYLTSAAEMSAQEAGYLTLDDPVLGLLDAGNSLAY